MRISDWSSDVCSSDLYKGGHFNIPALIPQVYLHYDPSTQLTRRAAGESGSPLARQRMDFLILFSSRHRVVLEVDGKQHYANGDTASPALYSEMVAEDRRRSEEHTSELQSLMRISYAVFCFKNKTRRLECTTITIPH